MSRLRIGVYPASERESRKRLFSALEVAHEVQFVGLDSMDMKPLNALVCFGPYGNQPRDVPVLQYIDSGVDLVAGDRRVAFADSREMHPVLAGRSLVETHLQTWSGIAPQAGDEILATHERMPVWIRRGPVDVATSAPDELGNNECLREHFRCGRFLQLLPLLELLRRIQQPLGWQSPPLRALITFDDPNLHWPSYGYVDYRRMAEHAEKHNYHAAMGLIPLDAWFALPSAVRLFEAHAKRLSLFVHGNDHVKYELDRGLSESQCLSLLAQAMQRTRSFERHTGLRVSPVMAAPHNACSEVMTRAMLRSDLEALCVCGRLHPWLRELGDRPLTGWGLADLLAGGMPVIHRLNADLWRTQDVHRENAILHAYQNRPLVFVAHHDSFYNGLENLAAIAAQVNSFGDVPWMTFAEVARSNYQSRVDGETLHVRLASRRVQLDIPDGIRQVVVEKAPSDEAAEKEWVEIGTREMMMDESGQAQFDVAAGGQCEILVRSVAPIDKAAVPSPGISVWACARRLMTAGRDRLQPMVRMTRRA